MNELIKEEMKDPRENRESCAQGEFKLRVSCSNRSFFQVSWCSLFLGVLLEIEEPQPWCAPMPSFAINHGGYKPSKRSLLASRVMIDVMLVSGWC